MHNKNTKRNAKEINMTKSQKEYRRERRLRLEKLHGGACLKCGSKERLQFAHLTPTKLKGKGRGQNERLKDIEDNPQCYVLLCTTCHREYDKNEKAKLKSIQDKRTTNTNTTKSNENRT
jgi:hypothetical protein